MDGHLSVVNGEVDDICESRENPTEVCTWKGIKCNDNGEVEVFAGLINRRDGTGTLDFKFLPSSMQQLTMVYYSLSGTIELADLPENMKRLKLLQNMLSEH